MGPSLGVGTVVPLAAPVVPSTDGAPTMTPEDLNVITTRIASLASWPNVPLTINPEPAVLAALEADPAASPSVATLRSHLVGRQTLAAPYVGLDTGAWVASGLDPELDEQLATGAAAVNAALGTAPDGRTGLADPTLTPEALTRFNDLGLDRLVVPSDQLAPLTDTDQTTTLTELFDVTDSVGDAVQAIASDVALSAAS